MPGPSSVTRIRTASVSWRMSTPTEPPAGVCWTAFCSTFNTRRRSRSSSPRNGISGEAPRSDRDAALGRQHVDRAAAFGDDLVEIEIHRPERIAAGVGARQHQHVLDEPAQPARLPADDRQRLAVLGLVAVIAAQRDVGGRAHDRHRRAQLVRRVGHELALRLQRRAQPRDQPVERVRQLAELVGPRRFVRDPRGPFGAIRAARCAMSVIGRRPIDASHRPPAAASSSTIGMPTSIASCTSRCSRRTSESGLADDQDERDRAERAAAARAQPPAAAARLDGPDARRSVAAAQRLAQHRARSSAQTTRCRAASRIASAAAGRGDRAGRLDRRGRRVVLLVQLVLDDVLERGQQRRRARGRRGGRRSAAAATGRWRRTAHSTTSSASVYHSVSRARSDSVLTAASVPDTS